MKCSDTLAGTEQYLLLRCILSGTSSPQHNLSTSFLSFSLADMSINFQPRLTGYVALETNGLSLLLDFNSQVNVRYT